MELITPVKRIIYFSQFYEKFIFFHCTARNLDLKWKLTWKEFQVMLGLEGPKNRLENFPARKETSYNQRLSFSFSVSKRTDVIFFFPNKSKYFKILYILNIFCSSSNFFHSSFVLCKYNGFKVYFIHKTKPSVSYLISIGQGQLFGSTPLDWSPIRVGISFRFFEDS